MTCVYGMWTLDPFHTLNTSPTGSCQLTYKIWTPSITLTEVEDRGGRWRNRPHRMVSACSHTCWAIYSQPPFRKCRPHYIWQFPKQNASYEYVESKDPNSTSNTIKQNQKWKLWKSLKCPRRMIVAIKICNFSWKKITRLYKLPISKISNGFGEKSNHMWLEKDDI